MHWGWTLFIALASGIASFLVGWIASNREIRLEVYKRRLQIYDQLVRLVSGLVMLHIKAEGQGANYAAQLIAKRIEIGDYLLANVLFVSQEVALLIRDIPVTEQSEIGKTSVVYDKVSKRMAHELRLKSMDVLTSALSNPLSLIESLRRDHRK